MEQTDCHTLLNKKVWIKLNIDPDIQQFHLVLSKVEENEYP